MTTGHTSASIDVEVKNSNGTFVSSSSPASSGSGTAGVTAEFGVTTNNVSGYTLSISGPDNTGKLVDSNNSDTTTNYISTITLPSDSTTTGITASEFQNGKSGSTFLNTWGYKPSKYNSNANSNFFPAPTTTATTLDKTTAANGTTTVPNATNDYSIELGAKLDYTVSTGSYSKTFILTAVGNPVPYDITFADNTGDSTVDNIPAKSSSTDGITATSVILPSGTANIPTRTGYTFRAWCLGTVNTTGNVGTTCTGTEYNAGAEFPINQTTTNIVTLYATWTPNKYTCTKQYRLQNADDTWGSYNTEAEGTGASSTEQVDFGDTCSYSKSVADYKNSSDGTNNAQASTSGTMNSTNGITLSLSFYRNTYALTVDRNTTYVASASATTDAVHGSNYYRWGQSVSIAATLADGGAWPATVWSQTAGTTSSFADVTSASTTFTMPKSAATIYANGEKAVTYMQNWIGCGAMSIGDTVTLADNRDEEEYLVGKLADGNCWLLDNLRLDLTRSTIRKALTADNTNADAASLTSLKNGNRSAGSQYANYAFYTWNSSNTANYYNRAAANADSKNTVATKKYGAGSGKIGVYYNYCAASAGSYCYDYGSGTGNAQYDICPKGWSLPTGGTDTTANFHALCKAYNNNTACSSPQSMTATATTSLQYNLSTPLSGDFVSGSPYDQGSFGYFWSSTQNGGYLMYYLLVNSPTVYPQYGSSRDYGYSVRCIAKYSDAAGYMQDQTSTTMAALIPNTGDSVNLVDKRDGEVYKVAKLADGKYWMLDNLRLDLTDSTIRNALSADDTNADTASLISLKNGNRSAGNQYASDAFYTWNSSNASVYYNRAAANADYKNTVATAKYGAGSGKIGVYYNYCAASAGSYCYDLRSGSGNASYDICPKGWKMPAGNTAKGSYYYLYDTGYSANETNFINALSTPLSGYFYFDSPHVQGSYGFFWSSTWNSSSNMYLLYVTSSTVAPRYDTNRDYGYSVRCLLQ